ncbi:MAG TPA: ABC transporter permease [Micromonosporaceae bacterium]|jgi:ABC-2 type transport system permease protein|nr:ABC transporter permease [Micromonosporaceae bacterium]
MTIARITARGLFGRRRFLLLLPLPLLVVGLAFLADGLGATPEEWAPHVLVGLGLAVVLPVLALIIGTGVLGSEIDDGTVLHILAKPLPRREIILAKLAVAAVVTALTVGVPMFFAGLVAGSVRLGIGLAVGCAFGALAYSAFFLALSLLTRRPVLVGLVYVLLWEGILGNLLSGTRLLSIEQYVVAIADRVSGSDLLRGTLSVPLALSMTIVFTVCGTVLAIDRLRSFSVAGETS